VGVTPSVPVKANSGVRARVHAAGKVLEGDDKPTLLREDQHYLHYITMVITLLLSSPRKNLENPSVFGDHMDQGLMSCF